MAKSKAAAVKKEANLGDILTKLDMILRVLAMQSIDEKSVTEGARLLSAAGFSMDEIAKVLNFEDKTILRKLIKGYEREL